MIQPPKQKLLQNCTSEERNQFMVDAIFLLAHTQLQVEFLDNIKNVKSIWKQVLKRKAITLMEEVEPILKQLIEENGDGAQEQALFIINKVKELNFMAINEFNNLYHPEKDIKTQ